MNKQYGGYIVRKDNVLGGKPIIKGTRVSVDVIFSYVVNSENPKESFVFIKQDYPFLNKQQIIAAIQWSRRNADEAVGVGESNLALSPNS